jgi:hypothetical protein
MSKFKIVPLSKAYAQQLRATRKDDFGHEVVEQIALGKGSCRVSLQPFKPGIDRRLLFSHSPFGVDNAFNQPGPVFIAANDVEEYSDVNHFPVAIKEDKRNFPLSLIGYNNDQQMVFAKLVGDNDVDEMIKQIFDSKPKVAYLHARNAEAGCYICKIERG